MADIPMPQSPLEGQLLPAPQSGLSVREVPGMTQFQVILRTGEASRSLETMEDDGLLICATGPDEFWVFSEQHDAQGVETVLGRMIGETASLFDQSHGRVVLRIEGSRATEVLAKGTSLDLKMMPTNGATHTVIEHIPVLISRRETEERYDISVPRGYAASFIAWLEDAI